MKRYFAFLRGINVGGKNKIAMAGLKAKAEHLGFEEVKTYLNSGNLAFLSSGDDEEHMTRRLERMIEESFGLEIPVFVIAAEELEEILRHAPDWWGKEDREIYDNLIFIMKPATFQEVFHEIGAPKEGLEQIGNYQDAIFWSFSRKDYQKTNWWPKTAGSAIGRKLTIRTAGTVRKICAL